MTTINDQKRNVLLFRGIVGTVSDQMLVYLQSVGATSDSLPDAWIEVLKAKGATGNTRQDLWFNYLRARGFTGAMVDMELQFWESGGTFTPV